MNSALLLLADGRFPTGGHAHSAGVEAAVRVGDVGDEASLARYLSARLASTGVTEAAFAAAACDAAVGAGASDRLEQLMTELDARTCSPRLREVSHRLGRQLLRAARTAWPHGAYDTLADPARCPYPIVLGVTVAAAQGTPADAARLAMHHVAGAVTTAAVRLLALDPVAAAAIHASTAALVDELVGDADRWAAAAPSALPAWGGALTDILGEDHGAWSARLFAG